ncbi:permease prefix domain 1-containing protein [Gulosibacter bifidus]|uniref:Permease prefix domain 1-containing protein n=1 Tax=Gulosibacter bifidus TaxID=272239 RepID=A0ABW5RH66_9MICO|nr:permease prefix domain 1-containing protein [Gulosibacter bifidus]
METLTSYVDHMFRALPANDEVRRARAELEQMALDRYHELRDEGCSENEAVGRVITQFGNLDELADDLGIRSEYDRSQQDRPVFIQRAEADGFLKANGLVSRLIASGVATVLTGVAAFMLIGGTTDPTMTGGDKLIPREILALTVMFLMIGLGVMQFIFAGVKNEKFERLGETGAELDPASRAHFSSLREREGTPFALGIGAGVLAIMLGISTMLMLLSIRGENDILGPAVFLLFVAAGVALLVICGMRRSAISLLAGEGDYTPEKRNTNELLDSIAGIYWLLVVGIFLVWGLAFDGWERSWVIWPIAGVLFGVIAIVSEMVAKNRERK